MGDAVCELQCFLYFPLRHDSMRQHSLDQSLHKNRLARTIFQQQDAIEAIKVKGGIYVALISIVINHIGESDFTDGWHGPAPPFPASADDRRHT